MAQRLNPWNPTWQSAGSERRWLSLLVEAMEQASTAEIRALPCESSVLKGLRSQLSQPVSAYSYAVSAYSLRN